MVKTKAKPAAFTKEELADFERDPLLVKSFVESIDRWLKKKSKYINESLRSIEYTTENLMACFCDLNLLISEMEKYVLCQWILDMNFSHWDVKSVRYMIWSNYGRLSIEIESLTEESLSSKKKDFISLLEARTLWVYLTLKYMNINTTVACLNFERLIPLTTTITELKYIIFKKLGTVSLSSIKIYSHRSRKVENKCLKEGALVNMGIKGGPMCLPGEAFLYYDMGGTVFDDPILMKSFNKLTQVRKADMWFRRHHKHESVKMPTLPSVST